jgi:rhodanese-related sulfurtransferase
MRITRVVSILAFILLSQSCTQSGALDANEFEKRMQAEDEKIVLDVRTPEEFNSGHLSDAVLINYREPDFKQQLSQLDKSKPVFVYCAAGSRSEGAAVALKDLGFNKVYEMKGGIRAWAEADKPVVK